MDKFLDIQAGLVIPMKSDYERGGNMGVITARNIERECSVARKSYLSGLVMGGGSCLLYTSDAADE